MSESQPKPHVRRRTRALVLSVVAGPAVLLSIAGCQAGQDPTASGASPAGTQPAAQPVHDRGADAGRPGPVPGGPDAGWHGTLGADDGEVPDAVTVFDDAYPGVGNLDPDLLDALRSAATEAADDGVELYVNSGWRSTAYQEQLLADAVVKYGSREEAARWVASPATSPHVSGDAVDIGESDAAAWLSAHGAGYGLCPIYRNEPWHFELRPDAASDGCPSMYDDPTQDPRMAR